MHVDLLFMGVHGMDERGGFTTPNLLEAETNRALVRSARRLVVVADHTKWGIVGLSTIAELGEADVLVTDDGLAPEARATLAEHVGELMRRPSRGVREADRSSRLADGREIIYFDDSGGRAPRRGRTRARCRCAPSATEARYDVVLEEWVTVATHRQDRTHLPPQRRVPAVPVHGRAARPRSPTATTTSSSSRTASRRSDARRRAGAARSCASPPTTTRRSPTSRAARVRTVLEAWVDRTLELRALPGVEQVFPFENRGEAIGVTLTPPARADLRLSVRAAADAADARVRRAPPQPHRPQPVRGRARRRGPTAGVRVVARSDHWIAFVPAAARWPVELHVYPRRRGGRPARRCDEEEREDFCAFYLDLLRRLDALYGMPAARTSRPGTRRRSTPRRGLAYLHLELLSVQRSATKIKYLAGSEAAMGAFINDVAPEQLAARLRGRRFRNPRFRTCNTPLSDV